jgi:predicted nucleic acid-binding protein
VKFGEAFIKGVFCDTSFFIRLLNEGDALHQNAKAYFRYFLEKKAVLMIIPA